MITIASAYTTLRKHPERFGSAALLLLLIGVAAIRLHVANVPFERDQGEYAVGANILLHGKHLYQDIYSLKWPGIFIAYAAIFKLFGQTIPAVNHGLLVVNLFSTLCMFLIGRLLFNVTTGLMSAGAFAVFSLSPAVQGTFANSEHFVLVPALAGVALAIWSAKRESLAGAFFSGMLLAMAVVVKQHGFIFVLLGCAIVLSRPDHWRVRILLCSSLALGTTVVICSIFIWLKKIGVFDSFWYWTVQYGYEYSSAATFTLGEIEYFFIRSVSDIFHRNFFLCALMFVGAQTLTWNFARNSWAYLVVIATVICSFASICPGLVFRPHYFLLALPGAALLCGVALDGLRASPFRMRAKTTSLLVLVVAVLPLSYSLNQEREFYTERNAREILYEIYGPTPFYDAPKIARYIGKFTATTDPIAVIGNEPQLYFYSQREPSIPFMYTFPMFEKQKYADAMRIELIKRIERDPPKIIVYIRDPALPFSNENGKRDLDSWFNDYFPGRYVLIGIVNIPRNPMTSQAWGADVNNFEMDSWNAVTIYLKIPSTPETSAQKLPY